MTTYEIIIATFIYFATPIIGMPYFVHLRDKMIKAQVKNPPVIELFLVFAIYGVLLILILTALFGEWSAFASRGVIFIVFVAPILMAFISVRLQMNRQSTNYYLVLQKADLYYFLVFPVSLFLLFWLGKN